GGTLDVLTAGTLHSVGTFNVPTLALRAGGPLDLATPFSATATTMLTLQSGADLTNAEVTGTLTTPVLQLISTGGNIGSATTNFDVAAGIPTILASSTTGSVFLHSLSTTGVNLGLSNAANDFNFSAAGPLTVADNVTTANGDMTISAASGTLHI